MCIILWCIIIRSHCAKIPFRSGLFINLCIWGSSRFSTGVSVDGTSVPARHNGENACNESCRVDSSEKKRPDKGGIKATQVSGSNSSLSDD